MATFHSVKLKKSSHGTFILHYLNPDGRRKRLSAGQDERVAERQAERFNEWLLAGKDPEQELQKADEARKNKDVTLREFYPVFLKRHGTQQSKNTQLNYENSFRNLCRCPSLMDMRLADVSKGIVIDYRNSRMQQDKVKPATVNKEVDLLKCMLSRAVEWDLHEFNRLHGLRHVPERNKREVDLSQKDAEQLIAALSAPVNDIVAFAIYTGFRRDNILSLTRQQIRFHESDEWAEVDLVIKGGRHETYVLCPQAVEIIKRNDQGRDDGLIFPNPDTGKRYRDVHHTFDRTVKKLGIQIRDRRKFCFHDIRHVFATWLHQAGVSLDVIRLLLGHRDRDTTDRYAFQDRMQLGEKLAFLPVIGKEKRSHNKCETSVLAENGTNLPHFGTGHIRILPLPRRKA